MWKIESKMINQTVRKVNQTKNNALILQCTSPEKLRGKHFVEFAFSN